MSIVVLNSGGFDSTVLLHWVRSCNPDEKIVSLHFNYGQNSKEQEYACAKANSDKLGCEFMCVDLPQFSWTTRDFYGNSFVSAEGQELEYRNLVFLSYAVSYATSIGADEIYAAFLRSDNGYYKDTSPLFVRKFNRFTRHMGIKVITPFMSFLKEELDYFVKEFNIKEGTFFSCDTPVDGAPCGECPDCVCIKEMYSKITLR